MKTSDLPKTTFVCDFFFFISISKPRKGPEGNNKKRDRYIYINIFEKDLKKKKIWWKQWENGGKEEEKEEEEEEEEKCWCWWKLKKMGDASEGIQIAGGIFTVKPYLSIFLPQQESIECFFTIQAIPYQAAETWYRIQQGNNVNWS